MAAGRRILFCFGLGLVVSAGCATLAPGPVPRTARRPAPAAASPRPRTFAPQGSSASELTPDEPHGIDLGNPGDLADRKSYKPRPSVIPQPVPQIEPKDAGPAMTPPALSPRQKTGGLDLLVEVPDRVQVAGQVTYRLTVSNTGQQPANDVVIEAQVDEALGLPGRSGHLIRQSLGTLTPGEHKEVALTLTSDQLGLHACQFRVIAVGKERVWKTVSVNFVERRLRLDIIGPKRRIAGGKAEFIYKLFNVSSAELTGLRATVTHDAPLKPDEASAGVSRTDNALSWHLGTLPPHEGIQLQVEYDCPFAAENAHLLMTVSGDNVPQDHLDAYLRITPLDGLLDVQVADVDDPVKAGHETEYVITIVNRGLQPVTEVHIACDLAVQLSLASVQASLGQQALQLDHRSEQGHLTFDPVQSLSSAVPLVLRIRVEGQEPADCQFRTRVSYSGRAEAIEVTETTTINP